MATKQGEVDRRYAAWLVDPNDANTTALYGALEGLARVITARRCGQVDEVLVCELAAKVLEAVPTKFVLDGRARFSTWAHRAIWNFCGMYLRVQKQQHTEDTVAFEDLSPDETRTAIGTLDSMENKILLNQLAARLSPRDKAVLWGKLEGYTNEEIGKGLDLSGDAVDWHWRQLPKKMQI